LREGPWKYIEPGKGSSYNKNTDTETGQDPKDQLYQLSNDLGETSNLAPTHSVKVEAMSSRLKKIRGQPTRPSN